MFFLFDEKDVMPEEYYNMRPGEKIIVHAFFEKIMERRLRG